MTESTPEYPWYGVGAFADLQQGDLFADCTIASPDTGVYASLAAGLFQSSSGMEPQDSQFHTVLTTANLIVVSQSCELAKPDCIQVLLCAYRPAAIFSRDQRIAIAKDRYVSLHMIDGLEHESLSFDEQVVDFRVAHSVPKDYLTSVAAAKQPRVRLLPPYREHLAQAFARYFMRVGLPRNLKSQ